ncbi:MAG: DUF2892 domain-containing protein [Acidimicrobiales bacterium]|nr:DUF2892 domain-containing protein [Acidimicrobiales bacterium]
MKNVGTTDRNVRFAAAAVALILAIVVGLGSVGGIVLLVVAVIMGVTGAVGMCPIYKIVGVNTCKVKPATKA